MLAIGDVCGKGPRAAGVTALARHTLRAAALSGQSPTAMLRHAAPGAAPATGRRGPVHRLPGRDRRRSATHARLTVALAGHLPPLLIDRGDEATPLGEPGTLLGVVDPIDVIEERR